jgi:hypothetical protein
MHLVRKKQVRLLLSCAYHVGAAAFPGSRCLLDARNGQQQSSRHSCAACHSPWCARHNDTLVTSAARAASNCSPSTAAQSRRARLRSAAACCSPSSAACLRERGRLSCGRIVTRTANAGAQTAPPEGRRGNWRSPNVFTMVQATVRARRASAGSGRTWPQGLCAP